MQCMVVLHWKCVGEHVFSARATHTHTHNKPLTILSNQVPLNSNCPLPFLVSEKLLIFLKNFSTPLQIIACSDWSRALERTIHSVQIMRGIYYNIKKSLLTKIFWVNLCSYWSVAVIPQKILNIKSYLIETAVRVESSDLKEKAKLKLLNGFNLKYKTMERRRPYGVWTCSKSQTWKQLYCSYNKASRTRTRQALSSWTC